MLFAVVDEFSYTLVVLRLTTWTKRNKYINRWDVDQLAISKHDWEVEIGSTEKQLQFSGQSET